MKKKNGKINTLMSGSAVVLKEEKMEKNAVRTEENGPDGSDEKLLV